jgi:uncharacterized protein (DUF1015 family)
VVPTLLEPFSGYIPTSEFAHRVVGPPASTLSPDQRETARNDPLSFRYSLGRGAGSSHAEALAWVERCHKEGVLEPVDQAVLVYRQSDGDRAVTGMVADLSLGAYDAGRVKRHERTIAKTLRKMADYVSSTRIYGNPVALTHLSDMKATVEPHTERAADTRFTSADGLSHQLWIVEGSDARDLCRQFDTTLYITDGHHRLAAASLVATEEARMDARLPTGLFSAEELQLRSFARCVVDPEMDPDAVIDRLRSEHRVEEVSDREPRPRTRSEFGMRIRDRSFRLVIDPRNIPDDVYESLDVKLLQNQILGPVFGITNPRKDKRLSFVADSAGHGQTHIGSDAWFLPFPALVTDVIAVADSGRVMPAKSTSFAPKVPSGLVIRTLDEYDQ